MPFIFNKLFIYATLLSLLESDTCGYPMRSSSDHGDPCNGQEATYCMNGGTCYKIPSMNTLSCVCNENNKGSRCEQFQLLISSTDAGQAGLIAAVVIVALFVLVMLAVVIYYIYKMLKAKQQSQQNNQQQYWRVKPRV
ncbi:U-actitoxin-Avd12a-like isoform X2 [Plectropomus leopardus]|uniref:U-actitoxin-Avd12a-like isoform X2 n=1 Tax=Plectropomus leopardus TaxID=160734 RepID=UPI001C4CA339|nr:U-actitoxin-Avd12a-like isoform X2 [Plectropomus leopardus]